MSGFLGSAVSTVSSALGWSKASTDEVSIVTGGLQVSGWQRISIRTGIEIMPWSFQLETTEFYPDAATAITILPGASCQVMIGSDLVITGWVITVDREVSPEGHTVRVTGASKSLDLIDTSAKFQTYQINNTSPLALAQKICAPYNLDVVPLNYKDTVQIQQFAVILTEHPYDIIERVCRYAAVLFYDRPDGSVTISPVGSITAASGFTEGANVERFAFGTSLEGRFSEVACIFQGMTSLFTMPNDADLEGQMSNITTGPAVRDAQVTRYRPLLILAEQGDYLYQVGQSRAQWEVNRRYGRSQVVQVTCDSWRDSAGTLWTPNTLAPVTLPSVKCTPQGPFLIAEVVFRRDETGTHADVVLMPSQAFTPEPIVLNPLSSDVRQALNEDASNVPGQASPMLPAPGGPT